MSEIQGHGRTVLGAMLFAGAIKEEYSADDATTAVKKWMKDNGVKTLQVTDESGNKLGTLSLGEEKRVPTIVDMDALIAWVDRTHPTEIVRNPSIRPAFLKRLLADAQDAGTPVDTTTGEIPPGMEMKDADATFSRRPTAEAKERMRTLVRDTVLPQLPAAGQATPAETQ